jgi:ABC-type uncharacterized transport system permease subunit
MASSGYRRCNARVVASTLDLQPKPTASQVKPRLILALVCAALVGCTTIETPNGAKYRNFGFEKRFASLSYQGTNGVRFEIKGWTSEASAIAGAVAEGIAKGAKPGP